MRLIGRLRGRDSLLVRALCQGTPLLQTLLVPVVRMRFDAALIQVQLEGAMLYDFGEGVVHGWKAKNTRTRWKTGEKCRDVS